MSKFFKVKISEELLNKLRSEEFLVYCEGPSEQGEDSFKKQAWYLLSEQLGNFDASTSFEVLGEAEDPYKD
jgi:hypothetical protein